MASSKNVAVSNGGSRRFRLAVAVGLVTLGWSGAIAAFGASGAAAGTKTENHCIAPSGVDLNELFGVSEQIVAPGSESCTEVGSGEHVRPSVMPWFLNHAFDVTPDGFVPAGATPMEDFVAKFAAVKYVIDPGTHHERTYVFPNDGTLWTGSYYGFPLVNPLTLGSVKPLPVGDHMIETYWVFSALHCDGWGDVIGPGGNCFPTGQTRLPTMAFTVTPGRF